MSINLLDVLQNAVGDSISTQASTFLGESKENTSSALGSIMPALLGGLMSKGSTKSGAQGILDFLGKGNHSGGILNNLGGLFSGGERTNSLLNSGGGILDMIFGGGSSKLGGLIDLVTKASGLKKGSTSSLFKMAAPLLMGVIGRHVKNKALDAVGLGRLLGSQRSFVKKSAPSIFDNLGLAGLSNFADDVSDAGKDAVRKVGKAADKAGDTVVRGAKATGRAAERTVEKSGNAMSRLLPLLLALLAILGGLYFWRQCGKDVTDTAKDATETVVDGAKAAGDAVVDGAKAVKDAIMSISLPGGTEIKAGANSIYYKMHNFLSGKGGTMDDVYTWENLKFATGSANLTAESDAELSNLAAILNAYPNVHIRIEGHTDNTGDAAANLELSKQRAMAAKAALQDKGVSSDRMEAVGYGQEKPMATNDTDEGRRQNRRVDVYITKK